MKYKILLIISFLLLLFVKPDFTNDPPKLELIYPSENELLDAGGRPLFVVGKLYPSNLQLRINETKAELNDDGAFICYTPVIISEHITGNIYKGKFIFRFGSGSDYHEIVRTVRIKLPSRTNSSRVLRFDASWEISPEENLFLQKGEKVEIEFKATPGCKAYFNVDGMNERFPVIETEYINSFFLPDAVFGDGLTSIGDTIAGIYKGYFIINSELKNAGITIHLTHPKLGSITNNASGRVSTVSDRIHRVVKINYDPNLVVGRYGPGQGYKLFLHEGVKVEITGKKGSWLRGKLSGTESIYIPEGSVQYLPEGSPPPNSVVRLIRAKDYEKHATIELNLSDRHPVNVEQKSSNILSMQIYNVTSNIDWVFYDRKSDFIDEIKHSQPAEGILKIEIKLNQKTQWGYKSYYNGNILTLKINKPAKKVSQLLFWEHQLKDRIIVLDPGHTADNGSIGPAGNKEKDINFNISVKLRELLEKSGAQVFLTHVKDEDLPLRERKAKVNSFNPEICISVHNNAVPAGVNPLVHNGSSVYYYYPQALPLAKLLHRNFLNNLGLKDFGLYWDNLYMCRIPETISVLVEPAFMIIPEQEKLLSTDEFQLKIAESIFDALNTFYEDYSE